jgi:zinc transport system substrate-binding protein
MRIIVMYRRLLPFAALLLLPLAACGGTGNDGRPTVVASFYPLQFVAERIVGDHAEVKNLTSPGVEPHDLELTVRQVAEIGDADVALYESGLQPAVDQAIKNNPPKSSLDIAAVVHLDEPNPAAGEEAQESHDKSGHAEDPHFWQDPTLVAKIADRFAALMAKRDPANASDYRANNAALQADLSRLDEEYIQGLKTCKIRTLVVSHDAFEYLGRRYDLRIRPIAGLSPDAEPSPKHLQELAELIKSEKITTVFNERLASPKLANTLADELGIGTAVLDPIEGITSSDADASYLSLMRDNLIAIQKADSCT